MGSERSPILNDAPEVEQTSAAGAVARERPDVASPSPDSPAESSGAPAEQASSKARAGFDDTAMAFPNELSEWSGRVIDDRYRIVRLLGEGGMGAVFVAEHLSLRKHVAFKVVRVELAGNGEVAARFAREAMATAQFEHPHVASAIDYGTLPEGGAYFVMQLVRGRSLRSLISGKRRLSWQRAAEIAAQVADALSAAKAVGIIHRDLKPDNILVEQREDGSDLVKVLDFGIAHVAPRDAPSADGVPHRELTRVGTVMGTPGYMAPEQAIGDKVDHRADLYALGVVLWECIAGRELWDGPDLTTVVTKQMTESVPLLRTQIEDPSFPPELDALVQRMTARAIGDRPEHAAEVRDALRKLSPARARSWSSDALARVDRMSKRMRVAMEQHRAQPPAVRRARAGVALATLVILATFSALGLRGSGDSARVTPSAEPAPVSNAAKAPEPNVIERIAIAASRAVKSEPKPPAKAAEPALPAELEPFADQLLEGKTAHDRRTAASKILEYKPRERVYPHLVLIAELETLRSCKARKEVIEKMKSSEDLRYLPVLRRFDRSPRSGCGFLSLGDCLSCIRPALRDALDALEHTQVESDSAEKAP